VLFRLLMRRGSGAVGVAGESMKKSSVVVPRPDRPASAAMVIKMAGSWLFQEQALSGCNTE